MDSPEPPLGPGLLADPSEDVEDEDAPEAVGVAPPVVAVVVTDGATAGLEGTVASLAVQDYPALSVLVLDDGAADDVAPRVATAMPHAYVRRLGRNVGFAAAANDAIGTIEGATFFLFCRDDVELDPSAVGTLVQEAYRSNAAVVGPKLVRRDRPEVLLEVGLAVDHYGVPFSGIEPNEIDQEQHDAVRDVFFVSDAVMLVRADLFRELGGFDPETHPGSTAVDLCWRARLAGARVLVAPDARVRAPEGSIATRSPSLPAEVRAGTRARIRTLTKAYSGLALLWVLPTAFLLDCVEALGYALTRRPRHGAALFGGWASALRHIGELARARRATQAHRRIEDRDVRDLMVRGSARFRAFMVQRLHAGDRLADVSNRTRAAVGEARTRLRATHVLIGIALGALLLFGSRSLVFGDVPEVASLREWPGIGDLWSTFTSPWRYTVMGADTAASPVFALLAALTTLFLGDGDLARTFVVAGALPVGAWGAYRLARPLSRSPLPGVTAAVAYAANPVVRNAIGEGHLGPIVFYALAPFTFAALLRATAAHAGRDTRLHATATVAILSLVSAAFWPPALGFVLLVAVAIGLATPLVGGRHVAGRALAVAAGGTLVAFVLLAPWSLSWLGADAAVLAGAPRRTLSFVDVLAFQTGRAGSGPAPWGLLVAAALPLAVATGPRLAWAGRAWMMALVTFVVTWLPMRLDGDAAVPAPEGMLVPAALALALATGLGVAAFVEELRSFRFGWRQLAAVAAAVGLTLPFVGLAADTFSGDWRLPDDDWPSRLSWLDDEVDAEGAFRVLWVGDPAILPADAKVIDGLGYATTHDGVGDATALYAAAENDASRTVGRALVDARGGRTVRLGHLLAPAAVRFVVVLERSAPDGGARGRPDPALLEGLASQLDLALSRNESGAVIYENTAFAPRRALVASGTAVPEEGGLAAAERSEVGDSDAVTGPRSGSNPTGPGTLLWSEAAGDGWRATAGGERLDRTDAFGWTNAFAMPERDSVAIEYDGGVDRVLVYVQVLLWIALVVVWRRNRPAAGERGQALTGRALTTGSRAEGREP